ncbi:MAG: phosphate transport system regulatory protein PhoU [Bacillus thermozeamaize]|uniref:Phosphate-specific transport system accessory protein PhoU n=1 Tax=Bacillus thermozeamaize TaxID=230954 RepID=A0A1Y3PGU4_9BACI|nr:MAG: phosphate transport system regulatory protein PhoU [Bacillus thermozeamaize]
MSRRGFHDELEMLHQELLKMGSLVEEAIYLSVKSLVERDVKLAEKVIMQDDLLDQMELKIEEKCLQLMALQQPMAKDLRRLGTMLKIVTDLERMADHAVDIAKATIKLQHEPYPKPLIDIPKMASIVQEMVHASIEAYIRQDEELAYQTAKKDDEVDALFKLIFNELVDVMTNDRSKTTEGTQLLMVAQFLERIGDHATNLNEWVIYMVTGQIPELNK